MKKLFILLAASILCFACTNTNTDKQAICSTDLKGRYEVDMSALIACINEDRDEKDRLKPAVAAMIISSTEMTMQFEDTKLIIDASGAAITIANAFTEKGTGLPLVVEYKIVNDSVLYSKGAEKKDFKKVGVLRKLGDSYDYLQLVVTKENGKQFILKLKKQL